MSEQEQQSELLEVQSATTMNAKQAIAYLAEKFPLCFSLEGEAKPLKIGLYQDLAAALENDEKISKTVIRQALRSYTMGWRYLAACVAEADRVDLNGNPVGKVDAQQAEHAAQSLAEAKAAYAERREQARKAQRKEFFKQKAREEHGKKRPAKRKPQAENNAKTAASETLSSLDASRIVKGEKVKVKVGTQAQNAVILDVEKQGVRVQLDTGLTLSVTADRLFA